MNKTKWIVSIWVLVSLWVLAACQSAVTAELASLTNTPEVEINIEETVENTPAPTQTETSAPTATELPIPSPTATPYTGPSCYTEELPYAYAESAGVLGWKYFTDREGIENRVIYFPPTCTDADLERDVENLFYHPAEGQLFRLVLLDAYTSGRFGQLFAHLDQHDFWAMGPEDYPMVLEATEPLNPNLILLRIDRLNGEGYEGNEILGRMVGLAEHEYIHTVQAKNNLNLADMIWNDGVYQAYIERFANLNNNSGGQYYMASYSYLSLLQMLDGVYYQGLLPEYTEAILQEMGLSTEEYLEEELVLYDSHIQTLVVSTAGEAYLTHLTKETLNPLLLMTWAGVGDLTSYELVRTLYDRYVDDYNLWYYGVDDTNYLPDSFDVLFEPTS